MDFAREFSLTPHIVEKDYLLGWVLYGIYNHSALKQDWIFKGGTCLKKCYFETYRFSEDLDFTITDAVHLQEPFLKKTFMEIAENVYALSGIEIQGETLRFDVYENPRGNVSVQGRLGYRGPMQQQRGDLPRIKLDLTNDEVLVKEAVTREVHHPYSDRPEKGIAVQCYAYEELFAEKIRALAERMRPRDLYDVIHLYRRDDMKPDRSLVLDILKQKCVFKGIEVPAVKDLESRPELTELKEEWENMLEHQLPSLPSFEQFWNELPEVFEWLVREKPKAPLQPYKVKEDIDLTWRPPAMAQAWGMPASIEIIRFAAVNHLCVNLKYQGTNRLIEPYSLRKTKDGNIILKAIKHESGINRSYRIDRIEGASATNISFVPRYEIELTASGPLSAPMSSRSIKSFYTSSPYQQNSYGPTYIIECPACGKRFNRKSNNTKLNKHKDTQGYPCYGSSGYLVEVL